MPLAWSALWSLRAKALFGVAVGDEAGIELDRVRGVSVVYLVDDVIDLLRL